MSNRKIEPTDEKMLRLLREYASVKRRIINAFGVKFWRVIRYELD